jgi:hypothetical protein
VSGRSRATKRRARRTPVDSASLAAAFAEDYRCPDCSSETELLELVPGVFHLEVRHDATCPTLRRMEGR